MDNMTLFLYMADRLVITICFTSVDVFLYFYIDKDLNILSTIKLLKIYSIIALEK